MVYTFKSYERLSIECTSKINEVVNSSSIYRINTWLDTSEQG